MPELPDIDAYIHALESRIVGHPFNKVRLASPFLLRTVQPPIEAIEGHAVRSLRRIGKRIAIEFDNGFWLVLHLMIAGRLHWRPLGAKLGTRNHLAAFDFPDGSLVLTEAGSKRRASSRVAQRRRVGIDRSGGCRCLLSRSGWVSLSIDGGKTEL